MVYFIIIFTILLLIFRYDYCRKETGRLFWYLAIFAAMVAVAGLRYRIGTDSVRYETYYKSMPVLWELSAKYFEKTRFEPGFVILMSACRSISKDFILFQFVHALIVNSAVFILFWRNSRNPFTGLLFYCFMSYMALNTEVLREALAVSVFIYAWPFFKRNNFLVYYLLILLAISFHLGASICLLCPLFVLPGSGYFFKLGKRTFFICAGILIVGFAINKLFFNYVKLFTFSAALMDRATAYAQDELGESTYNLMGVLGSFIKRIIYPILAIYFLNKEKMRHKQKNTLRHLEALALFSIYIALLTIVINIFHRFNSYFLIFTALLISKWIFTPLQVKGKCYLLSFKYWCLILLPFFVFTVRDEFGNVGHSGRLKTYMTYYPYSSRLTMEEDRDRESLFRFYRSW